MVEEERKILNDYKEQLKAYSSLSSQLLRVQELLDKAYYDLADVKAIRYDKSKGSSNPQSISEMKHNISLMIKKLSDEEDRLSKQIDYIDRVIKAIDDIGIRQATIDVYIYGKGLREVSKRFNCSHNNLKYLIDRELLKVLSSSYYL